ncbi:programmed cell death protein 2 domain protein [Oesophagostomum dentatum]|uniref:Programmed cell death protein 2 domain protein n=1 Tax=Oesophagostomum dentatum TaxID=61180 RepID=A0A0B1TC97_OESDE|nr:programmed cell death protein 2 domain protein [Oesophagostomum dentatum]
MPVYGSIGIPPPRFLHTLIQQKLYRRVAVFPSAFVLTMSVFKDDMLILYCCRDHQALDWTSGHKQLCGSSDSTAPTKALTNPLNKFVFKEFGIEMDQETRRKRMAEFESFVAKNKLNDNFKTEEVEAAVSEQRSDSKFARFNRLLNLNPEQVLRYQRSGNPLLATDRAVFPSEIPPCEKCGAPRTFELQLMPHLLALIDVDVIGQSIDWASVYVFSCSQSCEVENHGYAREYVCCAVFKVAFMSNNKSDVGVRQKRKRVGFADTPVLLKSPCNKTGL